MKSQERQKAILSLAKWIEKNVSDSQIANYPITSVGLGVNRFDSATEHARAQFLVSGNVTKDLAESGFSLAKQRYLKDHSIKK